MDIYTQIEESLKEFLLQYKFTVDEMGASPRSIGDKVQQVITVLINSFRNSFLANICELVVL